MFILNIGALARLMRLDKPVGIALLWFPTAWALWTANHGAPKLSLFVYFFLGTILMRSAGCVVNDMADRNIDKHVTRTKTRPITSGEVSVFQAMMLLFVLLLLALCILIQLPGACFYYAVFAVVITVFYPFCKRFFQAPQLVLGIAFSMGIPMAYAASEVPFDGVMYILFVMNAAWIVAYDTMYAMVDKPDDIKLGVKSTAILFAQYDRFIILLLQIVLHGGWLWLALYGQYSPQFYVFWFLALGVLIYQQSLIRNRNLSSCFRAFLTNAGYGLLMWIAIVFS